MKALLLAGLTVGVLSLGAIAPAEAAGGCGPYAHRGYGGYCRPGGGYVGVGVPLYRGYGYGYGWRRPYAYGYGWGRPGWGGYYRRW